MRIGRRLKMMVLAISTSSLIMMIFPGSSSAIIILNIAGGAGGNYHQPEEATAQSHSPHDHEDVVCGEQKCSPDGPAVRFPFRLIGKEPESCGYNNNNNNDSSAGGGGGYNLRCDELNRTIIELPPPSSFTKLAVTYISYLYQSLEVQSIEPCFAKQSRDADISTTPFQYQYGYEVGTYSLFNCSSSPSRSGPIYSGGGRWWVTIDCLRNDGYEVRAVDRDMDIGSVAHVLKHCTKMYDTTYIVSREMLSSDFMTLTWSLPQCQICEEGGGICRWGNRTSNQIGCSEGNKHHSGILKILRISGPIIGCLLLVLAIGAINLLWYKLEQHQKNQKIIRKFLEDYAAMKPTRYSYAEIKKITNGFKQKLGEGGYGNVFKGEVSNKIFVAVKLLHESTGDGEEFINEVGTMGTIHHVNVVRLLGFCADGYKRALVYEFLPDGSLDKFIFPDAQAPYHTLGMESLQNIAIGIARGIEYLHQGCEHRILHFDIKPHNILLDNNYNPKISDFGLAKLCEKGRSAVSMTAARGTMGYIAPEVFSRQFGNVSYKSDIYSFGMLLLEMVGRRKNIDASVQNVSQVYFPEWVYGRLVNGEELRIQVDQEDDDEQENQIAKRLAIVGLWCIQWNPVDRPSITSVLQMIEGSSEENLISLLPPNPFTSGNANNLGDPSGRQRRPTGSALAVISEAE